ncbi:MAG: NUDIX hydrolase [Planctomycetota bacterium]|jgi:8-oxo-dGTP pyrophosphatase MutT (NUDIX family)|nr:NUDIX hydrolase [Planctomycetota bacterium]MDG1984572.1 NUDIX hydrolase [Planctomycetota bacterium]
MAASERPGGRSIPDPRPWPRHGVRPGTEYRIFTTTFEDLENPRTGRRMERVVVDAPDWVNVVALTSEREVVIVKQHRFGIAAPTIEIPGGMVDPGEEPLAAAMRELREETGYEAERWTPMGAVAPNPAFLNNRCHHFLAEGCQVSGEQLQDAGEDIYVGVMALEEMRAAILDGTVDHSLVLSAMLRILDLRSETLEPNPEERRP